MPWSLFFKCWVLSQLFHSLSRSSRGSSGPLHFLPFKSLSPAYLKSLIFLWAILTPAGASSSLALGTMHSKQGDHTQPWHTPFPILNQSTVPRPVLTVASWSAYRFLRRQVMWCGSQFFKKAVVCRPVVPDSLRPHGLQHARPPCPSPTPRVCPSSRSLHRWCCLDSSPSDALFSYCPQSFVGRWSCLSTSDGQNTGVSASVSVLPVNTEGWSALRWAGLIPLLSSITVRRRQFFGLLYGPALTIIPDQWEDHCLDIRTFVSRVTSLLFNTLSRFVITFLPRSNHLLISWLQLLSTVILETKKRKSVTTSTFSPSICHAVMGLKPRS